MRRQLHFSLASLKHHAPVAMRKGSVYFCIHKDGHFTFSNRKGPRRRNQYSFSNSHVRTDRGAPFNLPNCQRATLVGNGDACHSNVD